MRSLTDYTILMAEYAHDLCKEVGPMNALKVLSAVMYTIIKMEMDGGDSAQVREMYALCEEILKKKPGSGPGQTS